MKTKPLFGVYTPLDPSTYSDVYPDDANSNIREIADLYSKLILLFVEMRYIEVDKVHLPPHKNPRINNAHPARFGFTKDVVDMYQLIPYIEDYMSPNWNFGSDAGEFIQWGEFLRDLRDNGNEDDMREKWLQHTIDPTYGIDHLKFDMRAGKDGQSSWHAKQGPYIRPWYAVLSNVGNHGSTMVLDTKTHNMWLVEQLGGSTDPVFHVVNDTSKLRVKSTTNTNDYEQFPCRPAKEFLEDIISRFKTLEWIPGGLYSDKQDEYNDYRQMYLSAGWPDEFDPQKFDRLRAERQKAQDEFSRATAPLQGMDSLRLDVSRLQDKGFMSGVEWAQQQAEMREQLGYDKAEYAAFLNREGRFSGMSDEDYDKVIEENYYPKAIADLEASLEVEDELSQAKRLLEEGRRAAQKIPSETRNKWFAEQRKHGWVGYSNRGDEWEAELRVFIEDGAS